jgi:Uma2 family endonuclease
MHDGGHGMATDTATAPAKMTAEEFFDWANRPENEGKQYELDSGEVIEVPPPIRGHGFYCWLVIKLLTDYVTRRGTGYLLTNDTGIIVGRNPDTLRGADVMVFLKAVTASDFQVKYVEDVPDLIVEIVSLSDRPKQLNRRVGQYLRRGVPLVWLIHPTERIVDVHRPNEFHKVLDDTDELTGNGILPDFSCRVADLFSLPGQQPPAPVPPTT